MRLSIKEIVLYIALVILASIEKLMTLSNRKWSVKNIILWTITGIAGVAVMLAAGAVEITPVVACLLFGGLAWLLPFSIINKRRF